VWRHKFAFCCFAGSTERCFQRSGWWAGQVNTIRNCYRNASSIPGPYYNIGPFSIQTLSISYFRPYRNWKSREAFFQPGKSTFLTRTQNFIQHCFCDLGSHFEALESVLPIFFLVDASKKHDQTDSCAPKCLPRVTKTVARLAGAVKYQQHQHM
jgi:hypothetical protein